MSAKSDALAGGKGVVLCDTHEEASQVLFDFMQNPNVSVKTQRILFERKLYGQEVSAFAALDDAAFNRAEDPRIIRINTELKVAKASILK